jgi:hypothetical protein
MSCKTINIYLYINHDPYGRYDADKERIQNEKKDTPKLEEEKKPKDITSLWTTTN